MVKGCNTPNSKPVDEDVYWRDFESLPKSVRVCLSNCTNNFGPSKVLEYWCSGFFTEKQLIDAIVYEDVTKG